MSNPFDIESFGYRILWISNPWDIESFGYWILQMLNSFVKLIILEVEFFFYIESFESQILRKFNPSIVKSFENWILRKSNPLKVDPSKVESFEVESIKNQILRKPNPSKTWILRKSNPWKIKSLEYQILQKSNLSKVKSFKNWIICPIFKSFQNSNSFKFFTALHFEDHLCLVSRYSGPDWSQWRLWPNMTLHTRRTMNCRSGKVRSWRCSIRRMIWIGIEQNLMDKKVRKKNSEIFPEKL